MVLSISVRLCLGLVRLNSSDSGWSGDGSVVWMMEGGLILTRLLPLGLGGKLLILSLCVRPESGQTWRCHVMLASPSYRVSKSETKPCTYVHL